MTDQGIWIFLDGSNLWIEAKKAKASSLINEFTEDPRLRIDDRELADLISSGRKVNEKTFYGSEPPPVHTVWETLEENGWKIKIYERSKWTGKEKKVDTQIVADVTALVCTQSRSTVVIVSGDSDMRPCIEKAIQSGWNVEVWAMETSLGGGLKRLQKRHLQIMTIHDLSPPECFDKFTFTNEKFSINPETENDLLRCGVVLQQCVPELQSDTNKKLKEILDKFKWPWQYALLQPTSSEAAMRQDLAIMFLRSKDQNLDEDTPLKRYMPQLKEKCVRELCEQVLTYFEYSQPKHSQDTTVFYNRFGVLGDCKDDNDGTNPSAATAKVLGPADEESNPDGSRAMETSGRISPSEANQHDVTQNITYEQYQDPVRGSSCKSKLTESNEDAFTPVCSKQRKIHQKYTIPCENHFQCVYGTKCEYSHTEQETFFFKMRNENVINKTKDNIWKYKTEMCNSIVQGTLCRHEKGCMFAHSKEEQVCAKCHLQGHPENECP